MADPEINFDAYKASVFSDRKVLLSFPAWPYSFVKNRDALERGIGLSNAVPDNQKKRLIDSLDNALHKEQEREGSHDQKFFKKILIDFNCPISLDPIAKDNVVIRPKMITESAGMNGNKHWVIWTVVRLDTKVTKRGRVAYQRMEMCELQKQFSQMNHGGFGEQIHNSTYGAASSSGYNTLRTSNFTSPPATSGYHMGQQTSASPLRANTSGNYVGQQASGASNFTSPAANVRQTSTSSLGTSSFTSPAATFNIGSTPAASNNSRRRHLKTNYRRLSTNTSGNHLGRQTSTSSFGASSLTSPAAHANHVASNTANSPKSAALRAELQSVREQMAIMQQKHNEELSGAHERLSVTENKLSEVNASTHHLSHANAATREHLTNTQIMLSANQQQQQQMNSHTHHMLEHQQHVNLQTQHQIHQNQQQILQTQQMQVPQPLLVQQNNFQIAMTKDMQTQRDYIQAIPAHAMSPVQTRLLSLLLTVTERGGFLTQDEFEQYQVWVEDIWYSGNQKRDRTLTPPKNQENPKKSDFKKLEYDPTGSVPDSPTNDIEEVDMIDNGTTASQSITGEAIGSRGSVDSHSIHTAQSVHTAHATPTQTELITTMSRFVDFDCNNGDIGTNSRVEPKQNLSQQWECICRTECPYTLGYHTVTNMKTEETPRNYR